MKKTYINPKMRVVQLECHNGIAELPFSGSATDKDALSRRSRLIDDWNEEDEW